METNISRSMNLGQEHHTYHAIIDNKLIQISEKDWGNACTLRKEFPNLDYIKYVSEGVFEIKFNKNN